MRWADAGAPKGDDKDLPADADVPRGRVGVRHAGCSHRSADRGAGAADRRASADLVLREVAVPDRRVDAEDAGAHEQPRRSCTTRRSSSGRCRRTRCSRADVRSCRARRSRSRVRRRLNTAAGLPPGSGPGIRLVSYVPGRGWEAYADGIARRLPKGAYIEMNMHYQPSGKPEKERAQFGIWFAKGPVALRDAERLDARPRHDDGGR